MENRKPERTRKEKQDFVDRCELNTPEDVARFFEEYTQLIWDHGEVGRIYDLYQDETIFNDEDGVYVRKAENVVAETLDYMAAVPDIRSPFIDIFAEGDPENGWRFMQAISNEGTVTNENNRENVSAYDVGGSIDICECLVKKVDGRWKIIEEWNVRTVLAEYMKKEEADGGEEDEAYE